MCLFTWIDILQPPHLNHKTCFCLFFRNSSAFSKRDKTAVSLHALARSGIAQYRPPCRVLHTMCYSRLIGVSVMLIWSEQP